MWIEIFYKGWELRTISNGVGLKLEKKKLIVSILFISCKDFLKPDIGLLESGSDAFFSSVKDNISHVLVNCG